MLLKVETKITDPPKLKYLPMYVSSDLKTHKPLRLLWRFIVIQGPVIIASSFHYTLSTEECPLLAPPAHAHVANLG